MVSDRERGSTHESHDSTASGAASRSKAMKKLPDGSTDTGFPSSNRRGRVIILPRAHPP
jgi:hypothetical protein